MQRPTSPRQLRNGQRVATTGQEASEGIQHSDLRDTGTGNNKKSSRPASAACSESRAQSLAEALVDLGSLEKSDSTRRALEASLRRLALSLQQIARRLFGYVAQRDQCPAPRPGRRAALRYKALRSVPNLPSDGQSSGQALTTSLGALSSTSSTPATSSTSTHN